MKSSSSSSNYPALESIKFHYPVSRHTFPSQQSSRLAVSGRISESGYKKLQDIRYPVLFQSAGYSVSGYMAKSLSGKSLYNLDLF